MLEPLILPAQQRDILALSLNPCIDVTIELRAFLRGETNQYEQLRRDIGGKGYNVAKAIIGLGGRCSLFGLNYTGSGSGLRQAARAAGLEARFMDVPGLLRMNIKLHERSGQTTVMTEFNHPGTPVDPSTAERVLNSLRPLLRRRLVLVMSGSLPPGLNRFTYREIAGQVRAKDGIVVLDSSGEPLMQALAARCDIMKPNRKELREVTGMPCDSLEGVTQAAKSLCRLGASLVLASLGEEGAVLTDGQDAWYAPNPRGVNALSLQGAGDAMTAVLAMAAAACPLGLTELGPLPALLQLAMAASQATIQLPGTTMAGRSETEAWIQRIEVHRLPL
ncbi:hexose kinase [Oscillospiraceae bacterium HV4-5-C5C]|nr:hexose kinase [Oscillospiraceae bacterium HV4-5-C5C]